MKGRSRPPTRKSIPTRPHAAAGNRPHVQARESHVAYSLHKGNITFGRSLPMTSVVRFDPETSLYVISLRFGVGGLQFQWQARSVPLFAARP
jgi:hypothetical protein